jgi:hypothetical protein
MNGGNNKTDGKTHKHDATGFIQLNEGIPGRHFRFYAVCEKAVE